MSEKEREKETERDRDRNLCVCMYVRGGDVIGVGREERGREEEKEKVITVRLYQWFVEHWVT